MTYESDMVYPDPMRGAEETSYNQEPYSNEKGLTKREYFAAMALQGLSGNHTIRATQIAVLSIRYADEVIAELNKPKIG